MARFLNGIVSACSLACGVAAIVVGLLYTEGYLGGFLVCLGILLLVDAVALVLP